jgi:hypothetical protein
MRFIVGSNVAPEQEPVFVLVKDNWNDWYIWYTMYAVVAVKYPRRSLCIFKS